MSDIALALDRRAEALRHVDRELAGRPSEACLHLTRGDLLLLGGSPEAAAESYRRAAALRPADARPLNRLGTALCRIREHAEALEVLDAALAIDPDDADAHNSRSVALRRLGRHQDAIDAADDALAADPRYGWAHNSRGNAARALGDLGAALAAYDRAIAALPDDPSPRRNRALCLLLAGDFARGWEAHEARAGPRPFDAPSWRGEPIAGKTILLHAEQGLGDTIQFARYAPLVADLGARVVLAVPGPLRRLMTTLRGPALVVDDATPLPAFDLHCPLMSLPRAFATTLATIPAAVPYLGARSGFAPRGKAQGVGLAWSGSPRHAEDGERSIPLDVLAPLLARRLGLVCLQREMRAADVPALAAGGMPFRGDMLHDFADTAALIATLDLVISADTAVAHLAGALGTPVWLLLPHAPDFRWMLGRDDSPWYPTMRLFRQPSPGDWPAVVARVLAELDKMTAGAVVDGRPAR